MIDASRLELDREIASRDKVELFDFYHKNWDQIIEALKAYEAEEYNRQQSQDGPCSRL